MSFPWNNWTFFLWWWWLVGSIMWTTTTTTTTTSRIVVLAQGQQPQHHNSLPKKKPSKIGGILENLLLQQQQQQNTNASFPTDNGHPLPPFNNSSSSSSSSTVVEQLNTNTNWAQLLGVEETLGEELVRIDVVASFNNNNNNNKNDSLDPLLEELRSYGFQYKSKFGRMVSGLLPLTSLPYLAESQQVLVARPVLAHNCFKASATATTSATASTSTSTSTTVPVSAGSVLSEAVESHNVDIVQNQYNLYGEGIKIGVLSNSYDLLNGATLDIQNGDLPAAENIFLLQEFSGDISTSSNADEGRAMMQLIHDIAPGAQLAFRTAFEGEADFAAGIVELADAGCNVIVDDVLYFAEPMFQDGIIAQAVDEVSLKRGIPYFSAAGNFGRQSYESPFVDSMEVGQYVGTTLHNFQPSQSTLLADTLQTVYVANRNSVRVVLQWDEPFASASPTSPGAQNDLDIYFFLPDDTTTPIAYAEDFNIGGDPLELVLIPVSDILTTLGRSNDDGLVLHMAIQLSEGPPPQRMKVIVDDGRPSGAFLDYPTNSGASYGHARARGGAGVGAVFFEATPTRGGGGTTTTTTTTTIDRPVPESFTSAGGAAIVFDAEGSRLTQPEVRYQPRLSGIDGVSTTFFGELFVNNPDYPNPLFFGSSAAAPNVAAIAALMLEENSSLSPSQIYNILEQTAIDMEDPLVPGIPSAEIGYDFTTGYGLVDAQAAIEQVLSLASNDNESPRPGPRIQSRSSDGKKRKSRDGKKKNHHRSPSATLRKRTGPIRRRRKDTT